MLFTKKTLCLGKTVITFAYEVELKSFLYKKVSTQKVTSEFNDRSFRQILKSQNSKGKMQFFDVLVFCAIFFTKFESPTRSAWVKWNLHTHPMAHNVSKQTHIHGITNEGF
jgi:hypothetical protein